MPQSVFEPVPPQRAITVITEIISKFEVDDRLLVESFFDQQQFVIEGTEARLSGKRLGGAVIDVRFDRRGRLTKIHSSANPGRKKPWWKIGKA